MPKTQIPSETSAVAGGAPAPGRSSLQAGRIRHVPSRRRSLLETGITLLLAAAVALLVRQFVIQSFSIPSPSMTPTLAVGDRLLVEKLAYEYRDVKRHEIIVFKVPESVKKRAGKNTEDDFVKRVVGLPGDSIEISNNVVSINGKPLKERFLPSDTITSDFPRFVVPIDEYFVMGDNRANSFDSRYWGTVTRKAIIGRVIFRFWPINRIGSVH